MSRAIRMLQIHVTRKCNLECLHCYSRSGPKETQALDLDHLRAAVEDAAELGYNVVSLSGGEPFLYPGMVPLLTHAASLGMTTAVVTNGMFLDARRLAPLAPVLHNLIISLDGAPERHNRMRANPLAFETMARKLPDLRASGIRFGFLFTHSARNADELDWAADFAADQGARMLQVHPLDLVGRAEDRDLGDEVPGLDAAMDVTRAAAAAQKRLAGRLKISVDYVPRMPAHMQVPMGHCGRVPAFSELVNPICIETDGSIVPMGHDFGRQYQVGQLGDGSLKTMAQDWMASAKAEQLQSLMARMVAKSQAEDAPELSNMVELLRHAALEEVA